MRTFVMAAVSAATIAFGVAGAAAQTKWDMPTPYPEGNFHTENNRWFAEEVKKATEGQLELVPHTGASLFKMPEIKRAVQTGQVPIGEILLSAYGNEDPLYEPDAIPFLAPGYDAARKLYEVQKPILEKNFADQGLRLLYSVPWPGQGIYTKKPIETLQDLQGTKFRAYNAATARFAELIGAQPTTVQQVEVPQAFATGVVDAMITSGSTGVDTKAWEFATHYYDTSAMHPRNAVFVNERSWRQLPEDVRQKVLDLAAQAEERGWEMSRQEAEQSKKTMAENGMTIVDPSPELMEEFRKISQSMIDDWAKRAGDEGQKIVEAVKQ